MSNLAPSLKDWQRLYESGKDFKQLKPWTYMSETDLFGVQNPQSGEIGYCCIMGELGEVFALAVYLGSDGLEGYLKLQSGEVGVGDPDAMHIQKCLMASFEDRRFLAKEDLQTIKKLGLKFRGRNEWPQFRSYLPGYVPWFLTKDEAMFLTIALHQTKDMALRLKKDRTLLTPKKEGLVMVRVPESRDAEGGWKDVWMTPPPPEKVDRAVEFTDEIRLQRLKKEISSRRGIWEIDTFYFPSAVKEGARPFFPRTLVVLDYSSGMALHNWLASPWEPLSRFQENLLDFIHKVGILPERILVSKDDNLNMLKPIASVLNIHLDMVELLDRVEEFRQGIYAQFLGEPAGPFA